MLFNIYIQDKICTGHKKGPVKIWDFMPNFKAFCLLFHKIPDIITPTELFVYRLNFNVMIKYI